MLKVSVSHSFFDIQITVRTQKRPSVFQVVSALYSVLPDLIETVLREGQKHWLEIPPWTARIQGGSLWVRVTLSGLFVSDGDSQGLAGPIPRC